MLMALPPHDAPRARKRAAQCLLPDSNRRMQRMTDVKRALVTNARDFAGPAAVTSLLAAGFLGVRRAPGFFKTGVLTQVHKSVTPVGSLWRALTPAVLVLASGGGVGPTGGRAAD